MSRKRSNSQDVDMDVVDSKEGLDELLGSSKPTAKKSRSHLTLPILTPMPPDVRQIYFKTPNTLKVQTKEFMRDSYNQEDERADMDGVHAVVRYRNKINSNGLNVVESNSKLVKWSDGTYQLIVGEHVFNVNMHSNEHWYVAIHC